MNLLRAAASFIVLVSCNALADDRGACNAGDTRACARLGQLKQNGALKTDGTKDAAALITACAKALEGVSGPQSFGRVGRACGQLFNGELQQSWDVLANAATPSLDQLLGTAYAEAYCSKLSAKVAGCNGKRAMNFSTLKGTGARDALRALNKAALELELGAENAAPLVEKFNAAWNKLLEA